MPLIQGRQEWYEDICPLTDGIVTHFPAEISPKGSTQDLDWFFETRRELRKTPGRLRRASLPGGGAVRGMHYHFAKANEDDFLLMHTTDRVFRTTDLNNFTQTLTGLSGLKRDLISYASVTIPTHNRVLWTDGVDAPKDMNADTFTVADLILPINVTHAKIVRFFKVRTILIDVTESGVREGQRVWYAAPANSGTYDDWNSANGAGNLEYSDGGGHVVQAVEFNDALVLFKEFRIGAMQHTGDELFPFRMQDFPEVPGTLFPNSPVVTPRGVLYLAYDGVRLFDGQRSILISGQTGFDIAAVAADVREAVVGSWDLRLQRYLLAIPGSGASDNDTVWAFHFGTNEAQLISQGQLYKRSQPVSVWGQFLRRTPMTLADLPVELQRVPGELGDPALSGAFPVIVSGDYSGGVHEQELLTDDDGEAVHAHVEFGPFPKDPIMVAHIGKVLTEVRFRGKLASGSSMNVKVRPTHKSTWTALPTPVAFQGDHFTVKVDGSGVEGEQFFIRLEDMGQYSWTRLHSMCLMGTHTGRPWKP